jgi:hypothetical protein
MRLDQQAEGPATAADRLANEIAARRKRAGDDYLEAFSLDGPGAVAYVCSRRGGVSRAVLSQDVTDALRIVGLLRIVLDRQELTLLQMGRRHNVAWSVLAQVLGLKSRQAAQQRMLRLEEGIAGSGRSEIAARHRRRGAETEPAWIALHSKEIRSVARKLSAITFQSPAVADDATELEEALDDPATSARLLLALISQVTRGLTHVGEKPETGVASQVVAQAGCLVAEWDRRRPPV